MGNKLLGFLHLMLDLVLEFEHRLLAFDSEEASKPRAFGWLAANLAVISLGFCFGAIGVCLLLWYHHHALSLLVFLAERFCSWCLWMLSLLRCLTINRLLKLQVVTRLAHLTRMLCLLVGLLWHISFEVDTTTYSSIEIIRNHILWMWTWCYLVLICTHSFSTSSERLDYLSIEEVVVTISSITSSKSITKLYLTWTCLEWHHEALNLIMTDSSLLVDFMNQLCLLCILLNHDHAFFILLHPLLQAFNLLILLIALTMHGGHLGLA